MRPSSPIRSAARALAAFSLARRKASALRQPRKPVGYRPRLEAFEDRTVLSTLTVLNTLDSGAGSLRDIMAAANPNDTIVFDPSLNGQMITLTSGELAITKSLDIEGPGASQLTISGNDASRVFDISSGSLVIIAGLTITHGRADASAPGMASVGGAILNLGALTLANDVLSANQAVGDAASAGGSAGFATGGGICNVGTLTVSGSTFTRNEARGASGSTGDAYPGIAEGGGIRNTGVATVTNCQFTSNLAQGGDGCRSDSGLAGIAGGGTIANSPFLPGVFTMLTVTGSTFTNNQTIGGNDNVSPLLAGLSFGGAMDNEAILVLSGSTFDHNQAIAGNRNQVTMTLPAFYGANVAAGGAINFPAGAGRGTISDSRFDHNQAIGGQGAAGSNGGSGLGGGIILVNSGSNLTVSDSRFDHNVALGGQAGAGRNGGEGWGGGLMNLGGSTLTVTGCMIDHNQAQGGAGDTSGSASNGGSGLGGSLYNDTGSMLTIIASTITDNEAHVGQGQNGGNDGSGVGGGVYNLGTLSYLEIVIAHNHADTSNDDLYSPG